MSPGDILRFGLLSVLCMAFAVRVHAKILDECSNQETGQFISNPNAACKYIWIYCDGDQSIYCNSEECAEAFDCGEQLIDTTTTITTTDTTSEVTATATSKTLPPVPPGTSTTSPTPAATTEENVRDTCRTGVYDYYPYSKNCNYYYQCINGFLFIQQCPFDAAYNTETRECERGAKCGTV